MPSRSFYSVPDFRHLEALLLDANGREAEPLLFPFRTIGVAPLLDEGSLARCIGIGTPIIFSIINRKAKHYRQFSLPKKSGGARKIATPRTYLKVIQWWILDNILSQMQFPDYVTGFVKGRSPVSNARRHFGRRHLLMMDLSSFFPSVKIEQVKQTFRSLRYSDVVADQLSELTTLYDCLPQGAPTSPALANLAARDLDSTLAAWAESRGLRYSRYADDLTFSSDSRIGVDAPHEIEHIVKSFNFAVNGEKTRFSGLGNRMEITGLVVNRKVQRPRWWRNRVRAIFHQAQKEPEQFVDRISELNGYRGALIGCDGNAKLLAAADAAILSVRARLEQPAGS